MLKKFLFPVPLLVILACCFFPVTEKKTTIIKAPFLSLYSLLANPEKWEQWQPDFRRYTLADSSIKIAVSKDSSSFTLKYADLDLNVKWRTTQFNVNETGSKGTAAYTYSLLPVIDKMMNKTSISAEKSISLGRYLIGKIWPDSLKETHLYDLKAYVETDSLRYGYTIIDTRVPANYIIEAKQKVLAKDKFSTASKMLVQLKQYIKAHDINQLQPVMAQFLPKGKDSIQVNVGLFVDKPIVPDKTFYFVSMPKGGQLYAIRYQGRFDKRYRLYAALKQYYADHSYHMIILPYETYLDDKLPSSDTDQINVRVNFAAVF